MNLEVASFDDIGRTVRERDGKTLPLSSFLCAIVLSATPFFRALFTGHVC
jgi:hypothetical protein